MTSATERLRALLDERGVEYVLDEEYGEKYPPEKRVTWSCDLAGEDMTVTARDYCIAINDDGSADYCLDLEFHEVFTPAQAIDATLGRWTCKLDFVAFTKDGVDFAGFRCDGCGFTQAVPGGSLWGVTRDWSYCPNCGRKVVE